MDLETILDMAGGGQEIMNMILGEVDKILPLLIILAIPSLVWACANCFFGYRIFRIVLVIQGVLIGGLFGAIIIGLMAQSKGGIIIGAILGAVIGGLINWYLYMIGVFLMSFGTGFTIGTVLLLLLTKSVGIAFVMGLILGLVAGVLSCMFLVPVVIVITAVNGGSTMATLIAGFITIVSKNVKVYNPCSIILTLLFAGLGIYVQYIYEKKRGNFSYVKKAPVQQYQPQPMPQPQPIQQPIQEQPVVQGANRICQVIGVEGLYKGFEFDIDADTAFGRDAEQCNIVFPKETQGISRVQCQITINPERTKAFIVDNHSSYGTQVNGEKLEYGKMKPLNNGDIIHFGENNIFRVQY